jgi:hypothetical protein
MNGPQDLVTVSLCIEIVIVWPFIVPSTRCTCVMIMLLNQLLDMPHLSGGWIISAKGEMLTNNI